MLLKDFIEQLNEYHTNYTNDHGKDIKINFYEVDSEEYLELNSQEAYDEPGIEIVRYGGCGCGESITLNFKRE